MPAFVVGNTFGGVGGGAWGNAAAQVTPTILGATGGNYDAWVATFDATGNPKGNQPYFVYLAGKQNDVATSVALVPQAGNNPPYLYVAGYTNSNDANPGDQFPATPGPNKLQGGFNQGAPGNTANDGFLASLNPSAANAQNSINFLGYIGGTANDYAFGVALDPAGTNAWVAGYTFSTDFRFGNVLGMQLAAGGGNNKTDGFVVSVAP